MITHRDMPSKWDWYTGGKFPLASAVLREHEWYALLMRALSPREATPETYEQIRQCCNTAMDSVNVIAIRRMRNDGIPPCW